MKLDKYIYISVVLLNLAITSNAFSESKKKQNSDEENLQQADAPLSNAALDRLDGIPSLHATDKDVILPNGENLYDFLKKNYPEKLKNSPK